MRRLLPALLLPWLAACGGPEPAARPPARPSGVEWTVLRDVEHLRDELARAKAERKPVVVETWATWCVYCIKYDEIAAASPRVRSRLERVVRLKIDATDDARNDLRAVLGIPEAQPRMRFVDRDGDPRPDLAIDGWNGPQSEAVLLRSLDGIL